MAERLIDIDALRQQIADLGYHDSASHITPDYRDGFNRAIEEVCGLLADVSGVMGTQADQLLRDLVGAHAEWDALHWSQRNQPGAADKLLEARRKARDYVAAAGVPEVDRG